MPQLTLAPHLARWLPEAERAQAFDLPGASVREAFEALFARHPVLRGYVLDEQGRIRRHVAVFVGGSALPHASDLSEALAPNAEVHILQALSGG